MMMPGMDHNSHGYHSREGSKYAEGRGIAYGPQYGAGDVVGCGVDFSANTAYFTKNGEHLGGSKLHARKTSKKLRHGEIGIAFTGIKGRLLPVVTIARGVCVKANFGQQDFVFKGL